MPGAPSAPAAPIAPAARFAPTASAAPIAPRATPAGAPGYGCRCVGAPARTSRRYAACTRNPQSTIRGKPYETMNMVMPLTEFTEEIFGYRTTKSNLLWPSRILPSGQTVHGRVLNLEKNKLVEFSPSNWHEVQPWEGARGVLLLYTPRTTKLQNEHYVELKNAGFAIEKNSIDSEDVVEDVVTDEVVMKRFDVPEVNEMIQAFIEMDDLDLLDLSSGSRPTPVPRATIKKSEVQCTHDIESILQDLEARGKAFEVTHTVSFNDVKKNIAKWYGSAVKEFTDLKDKKESIQSYTSGGTSRRDARLYHAREYLIR